MLGCLGTDTGATTRHAPRPNDINNSLRACLYLAFAWTSVSSVGALLMVSSSIPDK
jgi:hypothetical protein